MDCNDLNRRVRYALMLDDADVAQILGLTGYQVEEQQLIGWRMKEGQDGHIACPPAALSAMLDGLIVQRRGPREDGKTDAQSTIQRDTLDNNDVLKQLRIALTLKAEDVHLLIQQGGGKLTKSEVNALFRKSSARNYRRCGDQVLRWFLAGLAKQRRE